MTLPLTPPCAYRRATPRERGQAGVSAHVLAPLLSVLSEDLRLIIDARGTTAGQAALSTAKLASRTCPVAPPSAARTPTAFQMMLEFNTGSISIPNAGQAFSIR